VRVQDVPEPAILNPRDAIIRIAADAGAETLDSLEDDVFERLEDRPAGSGRTPASMPSGWKRTAPISM
jgi:hypothetical protein